MMATVRGRTAIAVSKGAVWTASMDRKGESAGRGAAVSHYAIHAMPTVAWSTYVIHAMMIDLVLHITLSFLIHTDSDDIHQRPPGIDGVVGGKDGQ